MSLPKDEPILADSPQENNKSFTLGLSLAVDNGQRVDGVRPLKHTGKIPCRACICEGVTAVEDARRSCNLAALLFASPYIQCTPLMANKKQEAVRQKMISEETALYQSANALKPQPSNDSREERQNQTEETTWQR